MQRIGGGECQLIEERLAGCRGIDDLHTAIGMFLQLLHQAVTKAMLLQTRLHDEHADCRVMQTKMTAHGRADNDWRLRAFATFDDKTLPHGEKKLPVIQTMWPFQRQRKAMARRQICCRHRAHGKLPRCWWLLRLLASDRRCAAKSR